MSRSPLAPAALLVPLAALPLPAAAADDFTAALTGGTPSLDMRLRYETVDQDGLARDAKALTLRTRLGYRTGDYRGFSAFAEFEDTTPLRDDDYNSTRNGKTGYPVVADPDATALNQAYLEYAAPAATRIRYGKQRIILDNARFVGNVGWRQNEQTFNALSLVNEALPDTTINYAYVTEIDTITDTRTDSRAHLLNARYQGWAAGTLTAYAYLVEFPGRPTSNRTLGLRFAGKQALSGVGIDYLLEFARQDDYKAGDAGIGSDYRRIEVGIDSHGVTLGLGQELLGADDYSGFETPLATKHAFNGWADKFLNTPVDGLDDRFLRLGGSLMGTRLQAVYHDFSADRGGADYGTEWDLLATRKFGKHYAAGVKYARYDADGLATDTRKLWVWGGLRF